MIMLQCKQKASHRWRVHTYPRPRRKSHRNPKSFDSFLAFIIIECGVHSTENVAAKETAWKNTRNRREKEKLQHKNGMKCERSAFEFSVADDNQTHSPNIYRAHAMHLSMLNAHAHHPLARMPDSHFLFLCLSNANRTHTHDSTRPDATHTEQQYPNKSKNVHVQHNSWTCARAHFDARMSWRKKNNRIIISIGSSSGVGSAQAHCHSVHTRSDRATLCVVSIRL